MSCRIIIRPEAERDLAEAFAWYEEHRPGLGDEFLLCVEACLASIQRHPALNVAVRRGTRRALLRRFPFGVFYQVREQTISVLAVCHLSRDPRRWQDRL
ncbi:type II toxin-antitoxin system RelE/ParE family toxin [Planctomycetota bacterium]